MDGGGWRWMENDLSLALIHQLVDVLGCWRMRKWWGGVTNIDHLTY